jgi:isopentenyl-diphosphate delta-isomerase
VFVGEGDVEKRKADHLRLAASDEHQSEIGPGWSELHLVHDAMPVVDADQVDLTAEIFGRALRLPLVIAGMTGGHEAARRVNTALGRIAERTGIAMGVGSQRAALEDPSLAGTFRSAREAAPSAMLIGNVGISQLVEQRGRAPLDAAALRRAIEMIEADALVVHLNYLEESVQPEGQTRAAGALDAVARFIDQVDVPVILKETGAGISRDVALRAHAIGVSAIDVGGYGGTSFASIEAARAAAAGNAVRARVGATFGEWGIPTAACVAGCAGVLPVIATGGVRTGLDAAKAIALGATLVGVGRPLLQAVMESEEAGAEWIAAFEAELRTAVFLTGGQRLTDLCRAQRVVEGRLERWLRQLGYSTRPDGAGD